MSVWTKIKVGSTICSSFMVVQTSSCWLPGHFPIIAWFDVADDDAPSPVISKMGIARDSSASPKQLRAGLSGANGLQPGWETGPMAAGSRLTQTSDTAISRKVAVNSALRQTSSR